MKRILLFEGAGMASCETSRNTIGNCRVRTAFHLDDGRAVYLELLGWHRTKNSPPWYKWTYTGWVDSLHGIGMENVPVDMLPFEYNHENVMRLLKELGATFDDFEVVNDQSYRVFADGTGTKYNFGERVTE